jgi:hypothetical protein
MMRVYLCDASVNNATAQRQHNARRHSKQQNKQKQKSITVATPRQMNVRRRIRRNVPCNALAGNDARRPVPDDGGDLAPEAETVGVDRITPSTQYQSSNSKQQQQQQQKQQRDSREHNQQQKHNGNQ